MLSNEQVQQYHEQGYVNLGPIVSEEGLAEIAAEEHRLRNAKKRDTWADPEKNRAVFFGGLCDFSQPLRKLCTRGAHVEAMTELIGPNVALFFNQMVTKHPDKETTRSSFPWHQDNGYAQLDPDNNITVWMAIDEATLENGCIWVIPGSHKHGLIEHNKQQDNWYQEVAVEEEGTPNPVKAGEAIAFSAYTLHCSKLNTTNHPRRAFFMQYSEADAVHAKSGEPVCNQATTWVVAGARTFDR